MQHTLIDRDTAKAQGLTRFFTGKPCRYGHVDLRYASSKTCVSCDNERTAKYREKNAETIKQRKALYYQRNAERITERVKSNYQANPEAKRKVVADYARRNPEKVKAGRREYYLRNKDAHLAAGKQRRLDNLERSKATNAAWKRANPEKVAAMNAARRAVCRKATPAWADKAAINEVYAIARLASGQVDHIVPLISPLVCGLHVHHNLQILTPFENATKSNLVWPDMP